MFSCRKNTLWIRRKKNQLILAPCDNTEYQILITREPKKAAFQHRAYFVTREATESESINKSGD